MEVLFRVCFFSLSLIFTFVSFPEIVSADSISSRLDRLEMDLSSLQRRVYRGEKQAIPFQEESNFSSSELSPKDYLALKVEELERQFSSLTNELETLQHELKTLQEKTEKINADANVRFKENEEKIENLEKSVATLLEAKAMEQEREEEKEVSSEKGSSPKNTNPKDEYAKAYALLDKKEFASAGKAFQNFLDKYPEEELAGNAQYWLGETYYARKKYEEAAVAFADGYKNYPKNNKAPDNFLKLGLSMLALGKKEEACTVFKEYEKEFPNASDVFKKRAVKEAEKLKCK